MGSKVIVVFCMLCFSASLTGQRARINVVPSFENAGVSVLFPRNVDPEGTSVSMAIRLLGSEDRFRNVHPLSHTDERLFVGSIFGLEPDTGYEVRLQSPHFSADQLKAFRTRSEQFPIAEGRTFYVSQTRGSDRSSGTSRSRPFLTVGRALSAVQAGDRIVIAEGIYHEGDLDIPRSGTADAPIVLESEEGARVVLDGTDPSFEPVWEQFDSRYHIYRTPVPYEPEKVFLDGAHFFRHASLSDLRFRRWQMDGFYVNNGLLYAHFPRDAAPEAHQLTIPRHTTGITFLRQSHWQIRGITFCHYGRLAFHRAIFLDQSDHILIERCEFEHNVVGIGIKRSSDFNTIQGCVFDETVLSEWDWDAVKSGIGSYEGGGVYVYGSNEANMGNVIRGNTFRNGFDGAHLYSMDPLGPSENLDFYDNQVLNSRDDAIETDGAGSNGRIYGNRLDGFLTGVSVAPAVGGPTYIMRNVFSDWRDVGRFTGYPIKLNSDSPYPTRFVYLYHNTCHTDRPGQDGFLFKRYSQWSDIISRNNIYAGTDYALENQSGVNPISFDYDNFFTTHPQRLIRWQGSNYSSMERFALATGMEIHGVSVESGFVSARLGDFELARESALIDRGLRIPGINDDFAGAGPDIGAYEYRDSPSSPVSTAIIANHSARDGVLTLKFRGVPGQLYVVRSTSHMEPPIQWLDWHGVFEADEKGEFEFSDSMTDGERYYRVFLDAE